MKPTEPSTSQTTTTSASPFTPEEFFRESGFGAYLERLIFDQRIRNALYEVGFFKAKLERIADHRLTVAKAQCNAAAEFRPPGRLGAEIRRSFGRRGLRTVSPLITIRKAGSRIWAHVGILEPET